MLNEAKKFLLQIQTEGASVAATRSVEIHKEIHATGSYLMNEEELLWVAKLAWRNSEKCIGRLHWENMKIIDAQRANSAQEVFES